MKKKLLSILLCSSMIFALAACGGNDGDTEGGKEVTPPTLNKLATFEDVNAVLTGDYEITDKVLEEGFTSFIANVGVEVEWTEVTDRDTIAAGDIVKLDYTGYLNDKAFEGGSATDQWIDVSKNCSVDEGTAAVGSSFIDGFTDGLIGAKVGETIKSDVKFPENYGNEDLNGQTTTFEFKIKGIYTYEKITIDSIDDAFVVANFKDYELETVEELDTYIRESMTYSSLLGYIIDNSEYDISDEYVDYRTDLFVEYQEAALASMYGESMTLETYLTYMYGCTLEDILPEWEASIKSQIEVELVYAEIVKEHKLEVDEKEVEEYILTNLGEDASEETLQEYYEYIGAGEAECGKAYLVNEKAVRALLEGKLGFDTTEEK